MNGYVDVYGTYVRYTVWDGNGTACEENGTVRVCGIRYGIVCCVEFRDGTGRDRTRQKIWVGLKKMPREEVVRGNLFHCVFKKNKKSVRGES